MMSHVNLLCSVRGLSKQFEKILKKTDVYIGYLPLAHVLELMAEIYYLANGIPIGKLKK